MLNLKDNMDLGRGDKHCVLSFLSIYCSWRNIKRLYGDFKAKKSGTTWNEQLELHDESYSVSNIQDYFEYIIKIHKTTNKSPIQRYVSRSQNRITFKIKSVYYHEFLTTKNIKLFGNTARRITKDKNGKNMSQPELFEVLLVGCNIVNNQYQQEFYIHLSQINRLVSN